ncbi:MAG: adenylate/guanylate cyclase domain-containing protein [Bdellovibrionota bacterium]
MKETFKHLALRLADAGVSPEDSDELRIQKRILNGGVVLSSMGVASYIVLMLVLSAPFRQVAVPAAYFLFIAAGFFHFARTRNFGLYRATQLGAGLLLPFLNQWNLGGFAASGATVVWGSLVPLGSLVVYGTARAAPWLCGYLFFTFLAALLDENAKAHAFAVPYHWLFFPINLFSVSTIIFILLRYFMRERELALERSETLLLNILPGPIAERLKKNPEAIADGFPEVTVVFADIVDFTRLSERTAPAELVALLNDIFSSFDRLAERHGLEKIKTIGDAYMVASGLPVPRKDHAEAAAEMALDMVEALKAYKGPGGEALHVRIGVNTGPVVAGVIGKKKYIYDLWGDAVNTASRMESHGLADSIQVTRETYERLQGRYELEPRGKVAIKGKGDMETFLLKGKLKLRG